MAAKISRLSSIALDSRGGRFLVDLAVVLAWVAVATVAFRAAGWSVTAYYAVVFAGVILYSLVIDPWEWSRGQEQNGSD